MLLLFYLRLLLVEVTQRQTAIIIMFLNDKDIIEHSQQTTTIIMCINRDVDQQYMFINRDVDLQDDIHLVVMHRRASSRLKDKQ